MKIYYAHPLSTYNTPTEKRDLTLLKKLGFRVVNPNRETYQKEYELGGMKVFLDLVDTCDAIAFRAFPDGSIPAGVFMEIRHAALAKKPVIELPSGMNRRRLSSGETREFLANSGQR